MLVNSSLAFFVIHESPSPIFKLATLVRAFSILCCCYNVMREHKNNTTQEEEKGYVCVNVK